MNMEESRRLEKIQKLKQKAQMLKTTTSQGETEDAEFADQQVSSYQGYQESRINDDLQSTQGSIINMRESDIATNSSQIGDIKQHTRNGSANAQQRSLAQDLKMRREIKERLSIERMNSQINRTVNNIEQPIQIRQSAANGLPLRDNRTSAVPTQSDTSGTQFRIRPQTPKINLLNKPNYGPRKNTNLVNLMPLDHKSQSIQDLQKRILYQQSQIDQVNSPTLPQSQYSGKPGGKPPSVAQGKDMLMAKLMGTSAATSQATPSTTTNKKIKIIKLNKDGSAAKNRYGPPSTKNETEKTMKIEHVKSKDSLELQLENLSGGDNRDSMEDVDSFGKGSQRENVDAFQNIQEKLFEIMDNEEVEDVVDLNEKFLSQQLGVEQSNLGLLDKIELRVDTRYHNLQITGEILSCLEFLKLNDSIVSSFRDIGTSFKNVRVLHVGRCELKEVQGIQAFEQLEELYIGYNEIDDLFDIGFIEHLTVLDFEGNNVKDMDQLYYLKRCKKLTHLNLKYNPVARGRQIVAGDKQSEQETTEELEQMKVLMGQVEYYQKIEENVPQIEDLDDEEVDETFFQRKIEECKKAMKSNVRKKTAPKELPLIKKFNEFGVSYETLLKLTGEGISQIDTEPDEDQLLVQTIKNLTPEQKASRDYEQQLDDFEARFKTLKRNRSNSKNSKMNQSMSNFRRTVSSIGQYGPRGNSRSNSRESVRSKVSKINDPMRESTMSFFKEAFSQKEQGPTDGLLSYFMKSRGHDRDDMQNREAGLEQENEDPFEGKDINISTVNGAPMSLLKSRRMSSRKMANKVTSPKNMDKNSAQGVQMSSDIKSLLETFHHDTSSFKTELRQKASQGQMTNTHYGSMSQIAVQMQKNMDISNNSIVLAEGSQTIKPSSKMTIRRRENNNQSMISSSSIQQIKDEDEVNQNINQHQNINQSAPRKEKVKLLDNGITKTKIKINTDKKILGSKSINVAGIGPIKAGKIILKKTNINTTTKKESGND